MMTQNGMGLNEIVTLHIPGMLGDNLTVYAGQDSLTYDGQNLVGYCVDLNHYAGTADVTVQDVTTLNHGDFVAYLLDTYGSLVTTNRQAAALGVAIWEVVSEPNTSFDTTSGRFYITGNDQTAADANALLADLTATIDTNPDWHVWDSSVHVLHSDTAQSFAVWTGPPVPEPATLSLLALGGLAMLRRR